MWQHTLLLQIVNIYLLSLLKYSFNRTITTSNIHYSRWRKYGTKNTKYWKIEGQKKNNKIIFMGIYTPVWINHHTALGQKGFSWLPRRWTEIMEHEWNHSVQFAGLRYAIEWFILVLKLLISIKSYKVHTEIYSLWWWRKKYLHQTVPCVSQLLILKQKL